MVTMEAQQSSEHQQKRVEIQFCEECNSKEFKYKCPACSRRTCSLTCVNTHKKSSGCTGKKKTTQIIPLSQFDDATLLSDYNLLEDVKRVAESAQRMRVKLCGYHPQFRLPFHLKALRGAAWKSGTKLLFHSAGMTKREKNQTRYNQRKKSILWTIEWRFHSTDVVLLENGVHESTTLRSVIEKHLQPSPWRNKLRRFCEEPLDNLKLFIRKYHKGSKAPYRELDLDTPLNQLLGGLVILEYPVIHVFLTSDSYDFEVVKDVRPHPISRQQTKRSYKDDTPNQVGVTFKEEEIEEGENVPESQIIDLLKIPEMEAPKTNSISVQMMEKQCNDLPNNSERQKIESDEVFSCNVGKEVEMLDAKIEDFDFVVIWACAAYTMRDWGEISKDQVTSFIKSCLMLERSGARLGLIGLFCLSLLFLPISRGSILLRLIDIPFEHATRYHVWLGHLTMVLFTLHGLAYVIAWAMEGRLIEQIFEWKDIGVANLAGVISLASGILMWVTSLPGVRTWNFELFFYTHQLYVVFVVFLAMHAGDFIFFMCSGGIFLFMLDRFLRSIQSRKTVDIISATSLPCGTVELVLSKPACLRYNALSFIFLQVQELSWLQWHPFSVSSSPLEGRYHLSVLIKVLGEWTEKLKGKISNNEERQKLLETRLKSLITASVEGPYGHESPYHLTYKHLILVAGGIGISPFLAILSDVMHRLKEGKPCMPKNILIVWAIKKSDELPLLSMINMDSIDPIFYDALNLDIQIYVTRESEPKVEEGKAFGAMNTCTYPISKRSAISVLAGTGDNIWTGIYIVASSIGFLTFLALLDVLYINPYNITIWWYKGLLVVVCMLAGVVIFGGVAVAFWHQWERRMLASESNNYDTKKSNRALHDVAVEHKNSNQEYLVNSSTLRYGCRPDFKDIFGSASDHWGAVDVGVLVCGPETLTSTVAMEIRSHSLRRKHNHPVFHFNSHSFDL